MKNPEELKYYLDSLVDQYNSPEFIPNDPISIPHLFSKKQDIEIAGFFAAIFAWGNRTTIIQKSKELMALMDWAPSEFIVSHQESDLKKITSFKHRTFNATDALYFIYFLNQHYTKENTLENAFASHIKPGDPNIENALIGFQQYFFSLEEAPLRSHKHIATPASNSACKRINMFLRWMVRKDDKGVDFGIWEKISMAQLVCPCDLHVERVGRHLGLIQRKQTDWKMALELTENLKRFDPSDPVKYDFALFGSGVIGKN